ncbi:serine/threonine-protein kinase [Kitasatospora sp. NPDC093806]|uniref:serine/threonine-protein kinase n=1 Tax=Kitasatospora sp. NPDC093806 TaxID=3155075 RepID=UPI003429CFE8
MGVVYRARSVSGRQVAVKVIRPELAVDAEFRDRFRQELAAARRVSGAFTAPVLDADPEAATPWLATLFIPGPSLAERIGRHGPLPAPQVWLLAAGLVEALRDIHRAGLVHRDLKPGNVLLAADGPRVIDFGIARALDAAPLTSTGAVVGTPPFMAPEQFTRGAVGPATDVFALGSVLVHAATGHGPFDGGADSGSGGVHLIGFRVVYEAPDLTGLPAELLPLVTACLAKEPGQRPSVEQLLAGFAGTGPGGVAGVAGAAGTAGSAVPPGTVVDVAAGAQGPAVVPTAAPEAVRGAVPRAHTGVAEQATATTFPPPAPTRPPLQPPTPPPGTGAEAAAGQPRPRRRTGLVLGAVALATATAVGVVLALDGFGKGDRHGADGTGVAVPPAATASTAGPAATTAGPTGAPATGPAATPAATPAGAAFGCASPAVGLRSAGGTSQAAVMNAWATDYAKSCPGASVGYEAVSVGAGFQKFLAGEIDFAVTDTGLTPEQVAASAGRCAGGKAVQLPLSALPVTIVYKVAGLDSLVLDAATVAGLLHGRITVWNDPRIAALNPRAVLPAAPVSLFVPSGDSATTLALTQYLAAAGSSVWPHQPDRTWPSTGAGQAVSVKDLPSAVNSANGSVSFLPATSATPGLSVARLTAGPDGAPVAPGPESASKTLEGARITGTGADLTLDVVSAPPAAGAYPIVQLGSAVVCDRGNKPDGLPALRSFLAYATGADGQRTASGAKYGGLPPALAERVRTTLRDLA